MSVRSLGRALAEHSTTWLSDPPRPTHSNHDQISDPPCLSDQLWPIPLSYPDTCRSTLANSPIRSKLIRSALPNSPIRSTWLIRSTSLISPRADPPGWSDPLHWSAHGPSEARPDQNPWSKSVDQSLRILTTWLSDPLNWQIHFTLSLYSDRSTLVYIYIYIHTYTGRAVCIGSKILRIYNR